MRGGLLGQGSILTVTSYANRTSPVQPRQMDSREPAGHAAAAAAAECAAAAREQPGAKVLTVRERMVEHRENPACASCHQLMDPVGLSTENFDAVGRWRTQSEAGTPIDASGGLPTAARSTAPAGFARRVLNRPDLFVTTLTEKLMTYALGRGLEYYDAPAVRAITRDAPRHRTTGFRRSCWAL